jgi:dTDP-4-dehydrorhamnose reductase
MSKKAIVLGRAGQLGRESVRVFTERGWNVTGFTRHELDVTNLGQLEQAIAQVDPELVLNATAYNLVDLAESEPLAAFESNALAVRNIALVCRQVDAQLVHFSTDYVFDGTLGRPYTEEDRTRPLGAYAVSKLAGELYAQAYLEQPLIVRTSGVFGPGGIGSARGNFVETMLRIAGTGQVIRVLEDHVGSPTYAPYLAEATAQLVEAKQSGVFHVGGGSAISWFDYARMIFKTFGLDPELKPTNEREYRTPARRPKYSALSNAKLEAVGVRLSGDLATALDAYHQERNRIVAT